MSKRPTKQNSRMTVVIDGQSWGIFASLAGGELSATITKRRPGGMGPEITYGGLPTTSNLVLGREYDLDVDHPRFLDLRNRRRVGSARVAINDQPLDEFGQNYGPPIPYLGRLEKMIPPEKDSTSADPQMISIEVSVETP